jgi:hypothetical protein
MDGTKTHFPTKQQNGRQGQRAALSLLCNRRTKNSENQINMEIHHTDTEQVAAGLNPSSKRLHDIPPQVARAIQVRKFMPERKKNLLAYYMTQYIEVDVPIAKAEALARTRYEYIEELNDLIKLVEAAELVIHQYKAEQASRGSYHIVI